jgi:hypothetical protein
MREVYEELPLKWMVDMIYEDEIERLNKKIERLEEALQKIADIEHEDIPVPRTPNEGTTWTVLAMAVGLAEKALKENV